MCPLRGRRSRGPRLAALGIGSCRGLHRAPWWGEARVPAPEDPRSGRWRTSGRDEDVGRGAFAGPVPGRQPVRPPDERPGAGPDRRATPPSDRTASRRHRRPRRVRVVPVAPADEEPRRWPWVCDGDRGGSTWRPSPLRSLPRPAREQLLRIAVSIGPRDPIDLGSDITVRRNDRVRGDGYTVVLAYSLARALSRGKDRACVIPAGRAGKRGQVNKSRLPNEPSQQRSPNNWHRSVSGMAPMSEGAAGDR